MRRLSCLKGVLQNMNQVQDVVQVNEVLLTEKDTTSLDTREVDEYRSTLKVCVFTFCRISNLTKANIYCSYYLR